MKKKEMKKVYREEMVAVNEVIKTMANVLSSPEPYTSYSIDGIKVLTREEFLENMIEWSIDYLAANVNLMLMDESDSEG